MKTKPLSFLLIVVLVLVFAVFLQVLTIDRVRAGGSQKVAQNVESSIFQAQENPGRSIELRLDEDATPEPRRSTRPLSADEVVELVIDDGSHFSAWGASCGSDSAKEFIWLNRFTPATALFPFYLNEIWVLFDDMEGENNVPTGAAIDLVVYQDADGDPANGATWLATFSETIQAVDGTAWSTYSLSEPVYISGPGDVILAVISRYVEDCVSPETYPATIDYTENQGRSWMGWWEGPAPDPADLPPDDSFTTRLGNWMIRGYGETTEVTPTRTPTRTATPTSTPTRTPTATPESEGRDAYLPFVVFIRPPTPALALLYVENKTGGELCYEVLETGIGEKCFPEGKHFYGSFPPGMYEWNVSESGCGSDSGSKDFQEGESTHSFWCTVKVLSNASR